jgi:hypothetical protein
MLADRMFTMTATKGYQFISNMESEAAGRRQTATWQRQAEDCATLVEPIQMVVDDLAAWNVGCLPYIQELRRGDRQKQHGSPPRVWARRACLHPSAGG